MKTTESRKTYKPLYFEWAYEAFEKQCKMHWLPTEINMFKDVHEYNNLITSHEKEIVNNILRFFTQTDVEVARSYLDYYIPIFKCLEIRMMLISFASMEAIHVASYSYLLTSLQLPDKMYAEFLNYKEMVDKHDYMQSFKIDNPESIALTLATVSGGLEGLALFSSFAILMYFSTHRKVRCFTGMGLIVSFSIRDESLHAISVMKLFHQYVKENPEIDKERLNESIRQNFATLVSHEFAFIDLVLKDGDLDGLTKDDLKQFIRYMADLRLKQLGLKPMFGVRSNPLFWMEQFINPVEMSNFLEIEATSYVKPEFTMQNTLEDVFGDI